MGSKAHIQTPQYNSTQNSFIEKEVTKTLPDPRGSSLKSQWPQHTEQAEMASEGR